MPRSATALLGMVLLGCASVWAQTSQIQGTVKDSSGAAVPGAEVKATQTDTDAVRNATSDADGSYVLSNLPIGPYRIEVTKQGFSTYVQTGLVLLVDTSPTVDVVLKLGAVNEQVQVDANAALVETQTINIGQGVENQRILDGTRSRIESDNFFLQMRNLLPSGLFCPQRLLPHESPPREVGQQQGKILSCKSNTLHKNETPAFLK